MAKETLTRVTMTVISEVVWLCQNIGVTIREQAQNLWEECCCMRFFLAFSSISPVNLALGTFSEGAFRRVFS